MPQTYDRNLEVFVPFGIESLLLSLRLEDSLLIESENRIWVRFA